MEEGDEGEKAGEDGCERGGVIAEEDAEDEGEEGEQPGELLIRTGFNSLLIITTLWFPEPQGNSSCINNAVIDQIP